MRALLPQSTIERIDAAIKYGAVAADDATELLKGYYGLVSDLQFLRERTKIILQRSEGEPIVHNVAAGRDDLDSILLMNPALAPEPELEHLRGQPDDVLNALRLVMDPERYPSLTLEAVSAWSPEQRRAAEAWAEATVLHEDDEHIDVPSEPAHVTALRMPDNAGGVGG